MKKLPRVLNSGSLRIGKWETSAHVLDNSIRVLGSAGALEIFSLTRVTDAKRILDSLAKHPLLRSHPATEAALSFYKPVKFVTAQGELLEGTDAESIIAVCRFLLKAREYGLLDRQQTKLAQVAESIIVSIANVGLAALIDEATGYQAGREREALQKLLEKYLREEYAVWAKRFPDEFYTQIFRLKGWQWKGMKVNRPGVVGLYTRDIVYARLAPGVLAELERINPSDGHGARSVKHHQWLTDDIGHPALSQHIYAVMTLMRASTSWEQFKSLLKRSFPRKGDQLDLLDLGESDLE